MRDMRHADTLFSLRRCAWIAVVLATLGLGAAERNPGPRSAAQAVDEARAGGLRQIQPGHYVYLHTDDTPGVSSTFNSGIIVTSEGVVVIDALGSEAIAQQVREAIAQVTDQPVRFLVSSTFHGRFTGGNAVYRDAFSIGHEHYRTDLMGLLSDASPEDRAARLPDQTYRERVTLHVHQPIEVAPGSEPPSGPRSFSNLSVSNAVRATQYRRPEEDTTGSSRILPSSSRSTRADCSTLESRSARRFAQRRSIVRSEGTRNPREVRVNSWIWTSSDDTFCSVCARRSRMAALCLPSATKLTRLSRRRRSLPN